MENEFLVEGYAKEIFDFICNLLAMSSIFMRVC